MPANYTKNYRLCQWEPEDKVVRTDFNEDNAKIDGAIKAEADARISGDAALSARVAKKAEQSDLDALTGQVAKRGNCQLWTTTYRGTGGYGEDSPSSMTFPKVPAVVFISSPQDYQIVFMPGQTRCFAQAGSHASVYITWEGATITWYCPLNASGQMNSAGVVYHVAALMEA